MAEKFRYLTMENRETIAEMWRDGTAVSEIAATIGVSQKTIYKELRRGWDGGTMENLRRNYDPTLANNVARAVISERGRRNASKKEGVAV